MFSLQLLWYNTSGTALAGTGMAHPRFPSQGWHSFLFFSMCHPILKYIPSGLLLPGLNLGLARYVWPERLRDLFTNIFYLALELSLHIRRTICVCESKKVLFLRFQFRRYSDFNEVGSKISVLRFLAFLIKETLLFQMLYNRNPIQISISVLWNHKTRGDIHII